LATCVVLTFYLRLSYRDMEEWLLATDQIRQVLELPRVPDHSTLARTFRKLKIADLEAMRTALLEQLEVEEDAIAVDTTNFRLQHASAYYMTRTGRTYRDWVKAGYAVGTQSQLVVGWRSGRGAASGSDIAYLTPLRQQAQRWGRETQGRRAWVLLGDAGFDGRITQVGDLIPVQARGHEIKAERLLARMALVTAARLDGEYGQRWKAELPTPSSSASWAILFARVPVVFNFVNPCLKHSFITFMFDRCFLRQGCLRQSSSKPLAREKPSPLKGLKNEDHKVP